MCMAFIDLGLKVFGFRLTSPLNNLALGDRHQDQKMRLGLAQVSSVDQGVCSGSPFSLFPQTVFLLDDCRLLLLFIYGRS